MATVVVSGVVPVSGAGNEPFALPPQASEVAQGVFFLGTSVMDGVVVDGYAFETNQTATRGRSANARPTKPGGGGGNQDPAASCYSFISAGAAWRTVERYTVGPDSLGVGESIESAFSAWENKADGEEIVGSALTSTQADFIADTVSPDGFNEVYSGAVADEGVLGYTIVWSTRGRGRIPGEIVEADMVIDDVWTWGIEAGGFDLDTVVLHEAGHWVGLGHTNTTTECGAQVMFPYVSPEQVKTLGVGDIAGIRALYAS
jgi:hypothetical protein